MKRQQTGNEKNIPLIYNLFPRHYKTIDQWTTVIPHIAEMGFNWVFVNPFHATGFSGSLYAIKNYYQLNPLFLREGQDPSDWKPLKKFIVAGKDARVNMMMDLVINHTAFDSVLVKTNPDWYKRDEQGRLISPHAVDPANADNVTVWGDLAEIDNAKSKDHKNLWDYWDKLICFFQEMGILGFRCDAAYQVSADLWKFLISSAKKRYPRTVFLAETLGCTMEEIALLDKSGFDYLFNSSKYWDFDKPWCLEQHEGNKIIAPSISFPESHDTTRLASEPPGTEAMQKMRYAFAAIFSAGILMPSGYEYGATKRIDVVNGTPSDVDKPQWDLTAYIKQVNNYKKEIPVLGEEGTWTALSSYDKNVVFLEKKSDKGALPILVCYHKGLTDNVELTQNDFPAEIAMYKNMVRLTENPLAETDVSTMLTMKPNELILFTHKKG